jgi:CHAT domain-containing protein/Tfp pilus assembly protein PilF
VFSTGALALLCLTLLSLPVRVTGQSPQNDPLFQLIQRIDVLRKGGRHSQAVPLVEQALSIAEKSLRQDDPRYVSVLLTAGEVYSKTSEDAKAEQYLRSAATIAERALEPTHPLYFASLANLALFYRERGSFALAAPLFRKVVALNEKLYGPESKDVIVFLKLLAESYYESGDYAQARPLYERALALAEKVLGTEDRLYLASLNDLAETYEMTGDYVRAATLLKRAVEIKTRVLGPDHTSVATSVLNLAKIARLTHNFEQAAPLYQRALAIYEKALGREDPSVATVLNQLGLLYSDAGDFARAEPFFKRALAIREKKLGPLNHYTTEPLLNLAWQDYARGNYTQAEPSYQRALQIVEKTQGAYHPNAAIILAHLAMLYEAKGEIGKAVAAQSRSNDIAEHNLDQIISQGTEDQKLLYMDTLRGETYGTISLHMRSAPDNLEAARLALNTILRRKGRALDVLSDSMAALRRRLAPEDVALLDQLTTARSQLATTMLRGVDAAGESAQQQQRQATISRLEAEIGRLETAVSARSAEYRARVRPVTLEQVQMAIPEGSALIEFLFYQPFDVKAGDSRAWSKPRYAVYLLRHEGTPAWVDLGEAALVDAYVERLRAALRDQHRADVKEMARSLDERVMRPVRKLLGDTRMLLLSPDGALNLIPFGALVDEQNRYLLETYSFTYLTSGRDLLRFQTDSSGEQRPVVVVANPAYDQPGSVSPQREPGERATTRSFDFSKAHFRPLPGTAEEAQALKAIMPKARLLTGSQAAEATIKKMAGPAILHVATHGFFLADQEPDALAAGRNSRLLEMVDNSNGKGAVRIENPLLRSGLALAGANQRQGGEGEDGILTALEAAGLNLWGTKLVVLSACETGLGDIRSGDGVYGLRRALVIAGAESQVMSLWQVSDTATRDLMADYYKRLISGGGRSEALRQVQLEMLGNRERSHPYFWAGFIPIGDWRNLAGK